MVHPIESLSEKALIALVKLTITGRTLVVSNTAPYEELQRAGYAYRVASIRNGFVFNEDNRKEMIQALGLSR